MEGNLSMFDPIDQTLARSSRVAIASRLIRLGRELMITLEAIRNKEYVLDLQWRQTGARRWTAVLVNRVTGARYEVNSKRALSRALAALVEERGAPE